MRSNRTEYWRKLIGEQPSSGQSIRAFCKQQGVSDYSFYVWRRRLAQRRTERFAELQVVGSPTPVNAIELTLATGERLHIPNGIEAATLRLVLQVLRA